MQRITTLRSYGGTAFRKACPTIQTKSGTGFPDGASLGNYDPEFELETGYGFPIEPVPETASQNRRSNRDDISPTTTQRLVTFVEEVFDDGGDALGTLGRHIDKVGRTHELILVDVLADSTKRLFVVARRKRKVTVVLGEDGKTRDLLGAA